MAKLSWLKADLHVHTVLSPCGELDMGPKGIVTVAAERNLDLIGITDHNAWANVAAVTEVAKSYGITVLPGMEVQTAEEVHVLCFFPTLDQLAVVGQQIYSRLPAIPNKPAIFGDQIIVDAEENIVAFEDRMLLNSVELTLEEVRDLTCRHGGIIIPAHVDRPAFSLIANLGFVPPDLKPAALEISAHVDEKTALERFPMLEGYTLVTSSDAHRLEDIKTPRSTFFRVAAPTLTEIAWACAGHGNRKVVIASEDTIF
ncbi:MAG TPA: PHP domain-containing protein [bacterium]|nr:PHP domain-containing protein [bacterium]